LANDSQDMVLLANILFQNSNKSPIVSEARRALRPGGSLIVIDWRKGTGGFGPPDDLRTDEEAMKQLVIGSDGLQFVSSVDAGIFHYGMIFKKI
jgi:SAM-dependent methyltransferase